MILFSFNASASVYANGSILYIWYDFQKQRVSHVTKLRYNVFMTLHYNLQER